MREFIIPNYHVILIHYPLALVTIGTMIEIFSFLWRRSGFRAAGRWMILIGALSSIPAATSGIYAARDVLSDEQGLTWKELKEGSSFNSGRTAEKWDELRDHVILNAAATGVFAIIVVAWLGCSDRWRARLHFPFVILLIVGLGLITSAAWHGGEMIYRHGIAVETDQPAFAEHLEEKEAPQHTWHEKLQAYVPPLQAHIMLAGWTVSMALASLGLAIRAITATRPRADWEIARPGDLDIADALNERAGDVGMPPIQREITTSELPTDDSPVKTVPAARFWLVTTLLALGTGALGFWEISPDSVKDAIDHLKDPDHFRTLAHGVVAGTIVVLTLVLAILARWGKRNKLMLTAFAVLMVIALAAQTWIGFLMMYDTAAGSLTRFN